MSQAGGEKELILGNRQLISLFFVVAALCGVFFAMGYMVRGNALKGAVSTTTESATTPDKDAVKRQQPEPPTSPDTTASTEQPAVTTDSASSSPAPIETKPAHDVSAPAPVPYAAKPDAASTTMETGATYIQVGALQRPDAESTARTLREQHLPTVLTPSSKENLIRVMVGPYHLTADVADAKAKLKALGFSNTIVQKQ